MCWTKLAQANIKPPSKYNRGLFTRLCAELRFYSLKCCQILNVYRTENNYLHNPCICLNIVIICCLNRILTN